MRSKTHNLSTIPSLGFYFFILILKIHSLGFYQSIRTSAARILTCNTREWEKKGKGKLLIGNLVGKFLLFLSRFCWTKYVPHQSRGGGMPSPHLPLPLCLRRCVAPCKLISDNPTLSQKRNVYIHDQPGDWVNHTDTECVFSQAIDE